MRMVIQRVTQARVEVGGRVTGSINAGLLVLLAVSKSDTAKDAEYLAQKVLALRIFPDQDGRMNLNVREIEGGVLVVSQFTLYGDCRKGRRPSFDAAAPPEQACRLYDEFVAALRRSGMAVETGIFQASMQVHLVNDGPVTLICDS